MPATERKPGIPAALLEEMERVARAAMTPNRDPETMRRACAEMDRIREEILKTHGILDVGVSAIRELRDSE